MGGDYAFSLPTGSTLKFLAPASLGGSDSNDGLAPTVGGGHGPWFTPNHPMKCGEVILAAPGTYGTYPNASFFGTHGTVSNCPSTTGGIDGTGGVWFAVVLCAGSDIGSTNGCVIPGIGNTDGYGSVQLDEGQSNWAYSGFYFNTGCVNTSVPGTCSRSFQSRFCNPGSKNHHIALINSITTNSQQGWAFNGCGTITTPDHFTDYAASVGVITHNSAQNGDYQGSICVGSIDFVELGDWDTNPGTHAYIFNNYGINNQSPACGNLYDGHAFYIDTPDAHGFSQTAVIANNIGYMSTRACIAMTYYGYGATTLTFKLYNNTCYHNGVGSNNTDWPGINANTGNNVTLWTVLITNNISYEDANLPGGGMNFAAGSWYAISFPSSVFGSTGNENIFKSIATHCVYGSCDAGFNVAFNNQALPTMANFFVNPSFTNTADLLANRTGVPNCTGFENTTACLGWNARTSTLTTPSVISDLTANCAQCTGKGFQRPSTTCAPNPDYPVWLKGVNYLKASGFTAGATITEKTGLTTKPCGM